MGNGIENPGYLAFVDALIAGDLKLGQTLKQDELCEVLGFSLSPMRETTTLLEAEGLITVRRRIGITIFYPDVKFVGNTFQFRGMLEREGLAKFARSVDLDWVAKMQAEHEAIIDYVQRVGEPTIYREPVRLLEWDFHSRFVDAFENQQIDTVYERLHQKMFLLRLVNPDAVDPASTTRSMSEHLALLDALGKHDVQGALDALDKHLQGVLHRILTT
ncbi:GntR family transcriptional regulator [Devosia rhodophyticola]|uniref:GntR family transcriptional regulator n=1 Tax=Devosia rhodophyticola TaxID=3026423 RepID=A0ABY7YY66_9HYPH|nr:GntR family transcriptional regulator [Devosia rhodophyticola]WDR06184.1 GntR family transcriptional regulator [Devosia rhodophyticola]